MAIHRLTRVIQEFRDRARPADPAADDGDLVGSFVERGDEAAFAALVRRHGPMVWGVCRRVAGHHQDAEDAFQATFLVLARKAAAVRPRRMVPNWLFGVAHRTALKARAMTWKRRERERQVPTLPEAAAASPDPWAGLEPLIDRELAALPDKYRVALVLCDLEGQRGKDVARQLKIPEGTLASRLRAGRVLLARRVARHGVPVSGGALATALTRHAASARVPDGLVAATVRAAVPMTPGSTATPSIVSASTAALADGVLKAMLLSKLKALGPVVVAVGLLAAGGLAARPAVSGRPVPGAGPANRQPAADPPAPAGPRPAREGRRGAAEKAEASDAETALVTYAVADLVVPIPGLDGPSPGTDGDRTKEDWLIRKITRTVSPASGEAAGGPGRIQYVPRGYSLVVRNTARVQAQVRYLLETMRRVQDVQVTAEVRILSLGTACFRGLQDLLPQLKKGGHVVLSEAEAFALVRKAQDDTNTRVVQAPRITFFPGQRVGVTLEPGRELPAVREADLKLNALVATNLRHLELEVKAAVGKADFNKTIWLEDGATLAQVERDGGGYFILLVTPRVILSPPEAVDRPTDTSDRATAPAADQKPGRTRDK
jgi:RNA polymerase sigma factor (sigma-70 family)